MATTAFKESPVHTVGSLPNVGDAAPDFSLTGSDLSDVNAGDMRGSNVVLNIFPSVDTGVCAQSVRTFNELATEMDNTKIVNVSADLPFALKRFCGAEGIDNAMAASVFRSSFGQDYGVTMVDGPLQGLLARSVVVMDGDGKVVHTELVDDISHEPNYDAVKNVLK